MPPTSSGSQGASAQEAQRAVDQQAADQAGPEAVQPCAGKRTWIEIRLVDMEGNSVPRKQYRIKLPDGEVKQGALDQDGRARVEGIQPGTCQVCFPELDQEAWERV